MKGFHKSNLVAFVIGICVFQYITPFPRNDISYEEVIKSEDNIRENQLFADSDVCQSTACQTAGKALKANLNTSLDPCDDFYEFACGGWLATHNNMSDIATFMPDMVYVVRIKQQINSSLLATRSSNDPESIIFTSDLYKSCLDNSLRESIGVKPLKTAMKKLGGWLIAFQFGPFDEKNYAWYDALATVIAEFSAYPLFRFDVETETIDSKVNMLFSDPGEFGIDKYYLLNQSYHHDKVNDYKKFILDYAILLGAQRNNKTIEQVDEIVEFETKLAMAYSEDKSSKIKLTFGEFNNLTNNTIDWINLVNKVYANLNSNVRVKSDDMIIVSNIEYHKTVPKLLETTPRRVIANYFGWVIIRKYAELLNKQFRNIDHDYKMWKFGFDEKQLLSEFCYNMINENLDFPLSRLYIDAVLTKNDKDHASTLVKSIKNSFYEIISKNDWLDATTKKEALNKLNAVHQFVGYPDWLRNNSQLDIYYNFTRKADPRTFFDNMLHLNKKLAFISYNSLRQSITLNTSWPLSAYTLSSVYSKRQNSITIPAAQLIFPYFDSQLPAQHNYGAVGMLIGHEFTHGFDKDGSQNDALGNPRNWWTYKAAQVFKKKADCLIKQYSSIYDEQANMTLNGKNTINEDIADNGGLQEAYAGYMTYVKQNGKQQRLPHISQYSPEQQFFISYANTEELRRSISRDEHSVVKYRINLPLANFKTFSDVYMCSAESNMNKKNKCIVW